MKKWQIILISSLLLITVIVVIVVSKKRSAAAGAASGLEANKNPTIAQSTSANAGNLMDNGTKPKTITGTQIPSAPTGTGVNIGIF